MSAPIATRPMAKVAAPIASFAPIQRIDDKTEVKQESEPKIESKLDVETEPVQGSIDTETKSTQELLVTIPPKETECVEQPTTPTVTSPTPPQSPASVSTLSKPLTVTKELSVVHDTPATPPAGGPKETAKPKKDAAKKKK